MLSSVFSYLPPVKDAMGLRTPGIYNHQTHLQERIKNANITYFTLQNFFKNKNISKKLKLILKNTIIDKTLTYALETSTLTKRDRKYLNIFERKCTEEF